MRPAAGVLVLVGRQRVAGLVGVFGMMSVSVAQLVMVGPGELVVLLRAVMQALMAPRLDLLDAGASLE